MVNLELIVLFLAREMKNTAGLTLTLQRLGIALEAWIYSALHHNSFSLMPTFLLDTARFVEAHAWGRSFYPGIDREQWEIRPLVGGMDDRQRYSMDHDTRLKREITSGMRGMIVRFRVPPDARLLEDGKEPVVAGPVDAFLAIERCHLSSGPESNLWMRRLEVLEDHPMRHDIGEEFRLLGRLWRREAVEELVAGKTHEHRHARSYKLEVPGRWITATLQKPSEADLPPSWGDVPRWDVSQSGQDAPVHP